MLVLDTAQPDPIPKHRELLEIFLLQVRDTGCRPPGLTEASRAAVDPPAVFVRQLGGSQPVHAEIIARNWLVCQGIRARRACCGLVRHYIGLALLGAQTQFAQVLPQASGKRLFVIARLREAGVDEWNA
ncbi:hypothetical protein JMK10_00160 [Rhodovulum sulfidophilum]|uniref:hypothetical protein n=1 Tax=Rhodovulum sulfidophilum TaxID=35806 RepID=UPI0019207FAB|nr:hypothetical protein [Rhodovulum sulfidophilum]MBL3576141.1 hypothetical protein [Rhodovulum sulfidophilum]MCE8432962.1 hypothetical protein [Rhodovulum sulfidophilum]MCF4115276.1 hypothetical protein [Rhodovulum sulfidophilum]